jgi:hypothetical protein
MDCQTWSPDQVMDRLVLAGLGITILAIALVLLLGTG